MSRAIAFINPSLTTRNVGDLFIADSVKRILRFDPKASIDIDPRFGMTAEDLQTGKFQRSGSISVAESSQATQRENPAKKDAVLAALPQSQICG